MSVDPDTKYFIGYFIAWALLSTFSIRWIKSRTTASEKKQWSDRLAVVSDVFVSGFGCFFLVRWGHYMFIPLVIGTGVLVTYLHIRNTFFCAGCDKGCQSPQFSSTFHCPNCGQRLR